ncbi:MAG: pitrilysin family protein [Myxococcales bacterium]
MSLAPTHPTQRFDLHGNTVVLLEESHAIPLVSFVVALRTGSAYDPPGQEGLARITARMLRRGSLGLSSNETEDQLDRLGSDMSVDTSASSMSIHVSVIGRSIDAFIELLARLLATPEFPEDELERLKRESIAEIIEARDHDRIVAQKAFKRTLFPGHPYGRNAGGTTASVATITQTDVRAFYKSHFTRSNLVIGFAGDLTAVQAQAFAERLVERLPQGTVLPEAIPAPVAIAGRRLLFVDKPDRTQTQVLIGALGTSPHDADHTALCVGNAVFGGTFTSRMMKAIRTDRGWSYGASSRFAVDRQRHAFQMAAAPKADDAAACLTLMLELLEKLLQDGVTEEEVAFMRCYLVRSYVFEIDTASKRMHHALEVELLGLPWDFFASYTRRVEEVTPLLASEALRRRLCGEHLLAVVVGTASETFEQVRAAIAGLGSSEVVAFDAE